MTDLLKTFNSLFIAKLYKVSQKSATWRHKNEGLSICFLGVFFTTSPLIPYVYDDVTWLIFFRHNVEHLIVNKIAADIEMINFNQFC